MERIKMIFAGLVLASLLLGCGEEGGLKGTLKISITDAPIDDDQVKAVNLTITNIEGLQNGTWKAFRNFEQPVGVNLLAYTGGKSVLLIDQFATPGEFSSIKLTLNMANRNSSLIVSPQSNVVFKNGTSTSIYMPEGKAPEVILEKSIGIHSRGITDITLDFDLRKSILINDAGEYILDPVVRFVETNKAGHIKATALSSTIPDRVVAYAYRAGTFSNNEADDSSRERAFPQSITSTAVKVKNFALGFLEDGNYDLIFAKHKEDGKVLEVIGRHNNIKVVAGEQTTIEVDLQQLNPS
jgi:hypothetical protein